MHRTQATFDFIYQLAGRQLHGNPAWYCLDYRPGGGRLAGCLACWIDGWVVPGLTGGLRGCLPGCMLNRDLPATAQAAAALAAYHLPMF
jgi:hypothetical protein